MELMQKQMAINFVDRSIDRKVMIAAHLQVVWLRAGLCSLQKQLDFASENDIMYLFVYFLTAIQYI